MAGLRDRAARLALQRYVLKELKDENDALTADVRDEMQSLYEEGGVKQIAAEYDGVKVGTVSATVAKPEARLAVTGHAELFDWALEHGFTAESVDMGRVEEWFERTGEVPPGCRVEQRPGGFKSISVRFDREAKENLQRLMEGSQLGEGLRGLLEGDDGE